MLSTVYIDILTSLVYAANMRRELNDKEYAVILDGLQDMRDDARYTEECQRENEREALANERDAGIDMANEWRGRVFKR